MALGALDRSMIQWFETTYHQSKSFPSHETCRQKFPQTFRYKSDYDAFLNRPEIAAALHNRGLSPNQRSRSNELTEQQAAAILTVANLSDRRSLQGKLKALGVTTTQWNAWKKQSAFRNFLYSQLTDDFDSSLDRALSGLMKAVDTGNPRAVELYLEMTGRQPTANERNYRVAISRIVESITRHVKDPTTIAALRDDFEKIEQGIDPVTNLPTPDYSQPGQFNQSQVIEAQPQIMDGI